MVLYMCYVYYKLVDYQNVGMWLERRHTWHRYALVFWKEDSKNFLWSLSPCPFQYILHKATDIKAATSVNNFKRERNSKVLPSAPSFCKLITSFGPQDIRRIYTYGSRGSHFRNYPYITSTSSVSRSSENVWWLC